MKILDHLFDLLPMLLLVALATGPNMLIITV